jgi:hypothetical protein
MLGAGFVITCNGGGGGGGDGICNAIAILTI